MNRLFKQLAKMTFFLWACSVGSQLHAASICTEPANLIINGSFEKGKFSPDSLPDAWSWNSYTPYAAHSWVEGIARRGKRSVEIKAQTPDDAHWFQTIPVEQNKSYYMSGWIRTLDVAHSSDLVDAGANFSLFNTFTFSPPIFGTVDWTRRGFLFNSQSDSQISVAARIGMYAGLTTGTAWFDDLKLTPVVPMAPHPRWNILVLIYRNTDFTYSDQMGGHHVVASMAKGEVKKATKSARLFVEKDIPALTSTNMLPKLTVRYPDRPLSRLSRFGEGWWPSPEDTEVERDPAFDSVIVIWDPRATDVTTGQPVWLGSALGLTPPMGTGQTYLALIVEGALANHRNAFKHEWGHSILFFHDADGSSPKPTVNNHAEPDQYVNCITGAPYVWEDETEDNPIPNSIYNNESGFTHDYYSGTTATADNPTRCLGITAEAWAFGGPAANSGNYPVFTSLQRVLAMTDQVDALAASGQLAPGYSKLLHFMLNGTAAALAKHLERIAAASLRVFKGQVEHLVKKKALQQHGGELLIAAADAALGCVGEHPTSTGERTAQELAGR